MVIGWPKLPEFMEVRPKMNELKIEVPKSAGQPLYVATSEFRGQVRLDVREYYEAPTGELSPSKKGVNLLMDDGVRMAEAIETVINGAEKSVMIDADVRNPIFVSVSWYKGQKRLDVRHYYDANGEWKPTRKGVSVLWSDRHFLFNAVREMVARTAAPA